MICDTIVAMVYRMQLSDDQHLAYAERGTGEQTVLLLHGGGLNHRMWEPQLSAVPNARVIAPDARAHGQSSTPTNPYRLVDDVLALLDHLDVQRTVVVGVSMGAGTAIDLAIDFPDRVSGLVVSGTGTSDPDFRDPWVLNILDTWNRAMENRDPEAWIGGFLQFLPGPYRTWDQINTELVAALDQMVRHTLNTHILPVVAAGSPIVAPTPVAHINERLQQIQVPVLGITGELDAADHRRLTHELIARVPQGREVMITGAAHYPNLEYPGQFNRALREYLDEL